MVREEGKVCLEKWSETGMLTLERAEGKERLVNICMLGCWDGGMEGEKWPLERPREPRWFFFLSRGK